MSLSGAETYERITRRQGIYRKEIVRCDLKGRGQLSFEKSMERVLEKRFGGDLAAFTGALMETLTVIRLRRGLAGRGAMTLKEGE